MWLFKSKRAPDTGGSRAANSKQVEDCRLDTAWSHPGQAKGTVAGVGIIFKEVRAPG